MKLDKTVKVEKNDDSFHKTKSNQVKLNQQLISENQAKLGKNGKLIEIEENQFKKGDQVNQVKLDKTVNTKINDGAFHKTK